MIDRAINIFVLGLLFAASMLAARAQNAGAVDLSFDAGLSSNGRVDAMAVQADGKILVSRANHGLSRLEADGTPDFTFLSPDFGGGLLLEILPDGKILVGNSNFDSTIFRLYAHGERDPSFRVARADIGAVPSTQIQRMKTQADGKVIIAGKDIVAAGARGIARVNQDGALDASFLPGSGLGSTTPIDVAGLVVLKDGKIIIAGQFSSFNGARRTDIVRLHSDGTVDAAFDPGSRILELNVDDASARKITAMAATEQEELIVAVTASDSDVSSFLAKITPEGAVSEAFSSPEVGGTIDDIHMQADGRILIAGSFSHVGGFPRSNIARLHSNGSVDADFEQMRLPGSAAPMRLASGIEGNVYVAGWFAGTENFPRSGIARLRGAPSEPAPPFVVVQPVSQTIFWGAEAIFSVRAGGEPAPSVQWLLNGSPISGETNHTLTLSPAGFEISGRYQAALSNHLGAALSAEARLAVLQPPAHPGAVDAGFHPDEVKGAAKVTVRDVALAPLGGLYVAREVVAAGKEASAVTNEIVRFDAHGRLDPAFRVILPEGSSFSVRRLLAQRDGKVLALGEFEWNVIQEPPFRTMLARFNSDGVLDPSFAPAFGAQAIILDADLQPDGKVLVAGNFNSIGGVGRTNAARLLPDGSVDVSFDLAKLPSLLFGRLSRAPIQGIRVQNDNSVVVAGMTAGLLRLNADGSTSEGAEVLGGSRETYVRFSDNSYLIAVPGTITVSVHMPPATNTEIYRVMARLTPDNRFDPAYKPVSDGVVLEMNLEPDERVLIGGGFSEYNGIKRGSLARLRRDGSVDSSFDPGTGANGWIGTILPGPDGKVWAAGSFTHFGGYRRQSIVRLLNDPLLRLTRASGQNRLHAATYRGSRYRLESSESIVGEWAPLETLEGANSVREIIDPAPASGQRFYRLRIE